MSMVEFLINGSFICFCCLVVQKLMFELLIKCAVHNGYYSIEDVSFLCNNSYFSLFGIFALQNFHYMLEM